MPSIRDNLASNKPTESKLGKNVPLHVNKNKKTAAKTHNGTSILILFLEHATGYINAVIPMIANELNMLLPTTFPMAMSAFPSMEDITLTTNSGALVPNATIVKPITREDMLKRRAILEAPSVSQSAPFTINIKPIKNNEANFNPSI